MIKRSSSVLFLSTVLCGLGFHTVDANDALDTSLGATPIKRQIAALPSTPAIEKAAAQKFPHDVFSPDSADFLRDLDTRKAKQEREEKKEQLEGELTQKKIAKQLTFETGRAQDENRRKVEELNASIRSLTEKLEQNQETKNNTEARVIELNQQIEDLKKQETELSKEVQAEKDKKKQVMTASKETISDLERRLQDYRGKISELSTQRNVLTIENGIQSANADGLKKQIDLYKGLEERLKGTTVSTTSAGVEGASVKQLSEEVANVELSEKEKVTSTPTVETTTAPAQQPTRRRANFSGDAS